MDIIMFSRTIRRINFRSLELIICAALCTEKLLNQARKWLGRFISYLTAYTFAAGQKI